MKNNAAMMRNIVWATVILALFAVVGTALVSYTYEHTKARIAENERAALLRSIHAIIPGSAHDNDMFADTIQVPASPLLGTQQPVTAYRARKDGKPTAVAFTVIAPGGYNGAIKLLVGIFYNGTLAGVRAIAENETPGLGDGIEVDRSNWILGFGGKSLSNPAGSGWAVKKDGGIFDQFTGATITPRAVVKAVRDALLYYRDHRAALFASKTAPSAPTGTSH